MSSVLMTWSVLVMSSLFFSPLLLLGIPQLDTTFWVAVVVRLFIDSIAFTLFVSGVQKSPLSLTIPMTSLSPAMSILTGYFILHSLPSSLGFAGVLLTVTGLYFLNFDHTTRGIFSPFKAIFRERGVLYVTIAAVLWSVVSSLQKLSVDHSSVYFYTAFFQLFWAVCFTPIVFFFDREGFYSLFKPRFAVKLIPIGLIDAIKTLSQNAAYLFAIPAYVNSIGSTSIIFASLFGWWFFGEKIKQQVIPLILVMLGIICISFA